MWWGIAALVVVGMALLCWLAIRRGVEERLLKQIYYLDYMAATYQALVEGFEGTAYGRHYEELAEEYRRERDALVAELNDRS